MGRLQEELKAALAKAGVELPKSSAGADTAAASPKGGAGGHTPTSRLRTAVEPSGSAPPLTRVPAAGVPVTPRQPGVSRAAAQESPIGLPRAHNMSRIDWWVKVLGHGKARWALIEPGAWANAVCVFFVDQNAGVYARWDAASNQDAKGRLVREGFARLRARPPMAGGLKHPSGSFHYVREPSVQPSGSRASSASPAARQSDKPPVSGSSGQAAAGSAPVARVLRRPVVEIMGQPRFRGGVGTKAGKQLRHLHVADGTALQCRGRSKTDEHEVTIGLDFGTSSTKVVIGDSSLEKSFAVPFCQGSGIEVYLLPARLYERRATTLLAGEQRTFSLESGPIVHRDLKLGWLANPESVAHRTRVVAFLALVLRHARGWLFHEHEGIFRNVNVVWRLSVGLPAASALNSYLAAELRKLVCQAWHASCRAGEIDEDTLRSAVEAQHVVESDLQVDIVAEIAAQVYGFVTSHSFDRKAANRYLLVDIGAGTVDSSLFWVKPGRGRKWEFEFYTAVVQPHGAANLHVHRINWWSQVLEGAKEAEDVQAALEQDKFATDFEGSLPASFRDYVDGVRVLHPGEKVTDPDEDFLKRRVISQVRGETLFRTWKGEFLPQDALAGIPMFLCGGGARMPFYQRIEADLQPQHGFRWLHAERWTLGFPQDLECESPVSDDYDRLSVAYGLSRLDVGKVTQAAPMPRIQPPPQEPYTDRYVSKDQT